MITRGRNFSPSVAQVAVLCFPPETSVICHCVVRGEEETGKEKQLLSVTTSPCSLQAVPRAGLTVPQLQLQVLFSPEPSHPIYVLGAVTLCAGVSKVE